MGAINSNLVIRSKTKREMLGFLVLITGCVLQRQWAKAQPWHSSGGMFICRSLRGHAACRNCDTFPCHPALPLTRSHTGAPFARKYTKISSKHICNMCATSGYGDHSKILRVVTYQLCQVAVMGRMLVGSDLRDSPRWITCSFAICVHPGILHPAVRYHYRQYTGSRSL